MEVILAIGFLIALVFIIRLFGAWMLRIDEVITLLKEIRDQLRINNM
jgi:hypothetical protein